MSAADAYRKIALDLQRQIDAMYYSRTWQLMLACDQALRSFREALRLPVRVWRVLTRPPGPPRAGLLDRSLDQSLAAGKSNLGGWPAGRPLVSVVILCASDSTAGIESAASLRASTLQDFEVLLVHSGGDYPPPVGEGLGMEGARVRLLEAACPDSAEGRNTAVAAAVGKYVVLLRGGDRLDPTFLEKAALALEEGPGLGFAYAQDAGTEAAPPCCAEPFSLQRALRYNHVSDSALFRREAWRDAGGFQPEAELDLWDFWVALGTRGWSGFFIREPLVYPGPESQRTRERMRDAAQDSEAAEQVRRRHAALLETVGRSSSPDRSGALAADSKSDATLAFPQRSFLNFGADRPAILCVVPWLDVGGAEQVVLQIMRGLSEQFAFAVATTLEADHTRAAEFREITPWVYHLPATSVSDAGRFLADLAAIHGVQGVLISSSEAGYRALPAIKQRGIWTADIVHNTALEGHLKQSIRFDRYLDMHFACGLAQAQALQKGVEASRIRTVWTAVDANGRFDPEDYAECREPLRAEFELEPQDVVLTYVGRLSTEKDVPLFVAAVAEIVRRHPGPRIRAMIAGEGPERLRVEQAIEAEGLWNEVRLLGDTRRVPELLAVSDYLFLTSRTEGSPITILEAMSLKVVVLSTAVGNVGEVIEDGVNGFVIEGRNPVAFADRFAEIRNDPRRETSMREAARRTILERFEESRMLDAYADAFRAALGPRGGDGSV